MTFENLTPESMIDAVEAGIGKKMSGFTRPLPSYINRVYELQAVDGTKLIGKFYRPGRWTKEAILDEHQFELDCLQEEIPVVAPLILDGKGTLGDVQGINFAVFPKRAGRQFEVTSPNDWARLGSLLGRIHNVGARAKAPNRVIIHPQISTKKDISFLCQSIISERYKETYRSTAMRLIDTCTPLFEDLEQIRIHGDCHYGNILDRMDEGLMVIDFDDMAMGPAVQDFWLLLPERQDKATEEIEEFVRGYERFRQFDRRSLKCIEPLRAMRMIYFLAWCSRQVDDYKFRSNFPDWGNDSFWQKEINDLREQLGFVQDYL